MKEREIFLEKKGVHALKSYLAVRGESFSKRVFLNYQGEPISDLYSALLAWGLNCGRMEAFSSPLRWRCFHGYPTA